MCAHFNSIVLEIGGEERHKFELRLNFTEKSSKTMTNRNLLRIHGFPLFSIFLFSNHSTQSIKHLL